MNQSDILKILMPQRTKQIALAWSILRQSHLAEDAYQDMLAKVFENEDIFEGPRHLRDWSWKDLSPASIEVPTTDSQLSLRLTGNIRPATISATSTGKSGRKPIASISKSMRKKPTSNAT